MKKLMIALAAITMGFAANAAQVQWNTGALYLPKEDGTWSSTKASNTTPGTWNIIVTLYADDNGSKGAALTGVQNLTSSTMGSTGTMTAKTDDVLAGNTKYWIDAVITYTSDAGVQTLETGTAYFTTKATGSVTAAFQVTTVLNQKIITSDMNFTPAPEPTSALLMLLGVAGLALRRRRA